MNKENLIDQVKHSIKAFALNYQPGDQFIILTFDGDIQTNELFHINTNQDLAAFYAKIDAIEAKGKWTNLTGAIEFALNFVSENYQSDQAKNLVDILLFTDGIHDPLHIFGKNSLRTMMLC
ncbi:MAG: VWA domain-containing protein [Oligoflexus sp.]